MRLFVYTLGCRVNQCESEAVAKAFEDAGHEVAEAWKNPDGQVCDLVIVNTCTVTGKAEQKARRMIRLFSSGCPVLVTGCYAQLNQAEIKQLGERVFVLPLVRKAELLHLPELFDGRSVAAADICNTLNSFCAEPLNVRTGVFDFAAASFSYHVRSYLKIQDGCDNACAYCRVHVARGKSTFLEPEEVVRRALEIERNGYREIVLTGVNLTMYDRHGRGLGGVIHKLLKALGQDIRLRLSSIEPDNVDSFLIEQFADRRIQPYFHIPVQSASEKVLQRVNRKCSAEQMSRLVSRLKTVREDPFLGCDIITGLPAEDEPAFEETRSFVKRHGFAHVHVFPFSPRPDTPLFKASDRVPETERDRRAAVMRALSEELYSQYAARQQGKENEVILETFGNGVWEGLSSNYLRLKISGVPAGAVSGELCPVRIVSADSAVAAEQVKE